MGALLLLIYYYPQLFASTTFRTGSGIRKMYESIGPLHANEYLGFTSLQGAIRLVAFMEIKIRMLLYIH